MTAPRRLVVEADGGSRGNPGIAGYGALVRDATSGRVLAERAAPLGDAVSNNVAEYHGLIAGLDAVAAMSPAVDTAVLVRMDSKLVVEQMTGRWKVKHPDMRRLSLQARDLKTLIERGGASVAFEWVPRAENAAADALSNKGMDGERVRVDCWPEPNSGEGESAGSQAPDPAFGEGRTPVSALATADVPDRHEPVRLVLVRHGVTDYTVTKRLDGRGGADPELNDLGLRQAAAAAGAVHELVGPAGREAVSVVTSSLGRARRTGDIIARELGVQPVEDRDWDEQGFGDWDGLALPDLAASSRPELVRLRADQDYARPGGESHRDLARRVSGAWARALARGGTVVVASHRKPLMCVLAEVLGVDHERIWSIASAPCSLTVLEVWPDGGVSVVTVNDTHHLRDVEAT
ncbi:MAG TPA: bifunctional RNase H/acid phosphatase [Ornithinimicrobium sp.]|uniref:bifunctional RNase H/acid phosphatase n=1 Tax=Ornithinimicrobium sp. TaxID=1977084 RepID=UPI002B4A3407|nr:bifunctional RNase H/acid phosphatase [Ornithinimicrobium sp.]HKJ12548.1 bifunctional RNase H/acid phosphatase [Ornithinimicrobium sp.]